MNTIRKQDLEANTNTRNNSVFKLISSLAFVTIMLSVCCRTEGFSLSYFILLHSLYPHKVLTGTPALTSLQGYFKVVCLTGVAPCASRTALSALCTQTVAAGGNSVTNGDCKRKPRRIARVLVRCRASYTGTPLEQNQ